MIGVRYPLSVSDLPSRAAVFAQLEAHLQPTGDKPTIIHLYGASGIGTSDILHTFADRIKQRYATLPPYDFYFVELYRPSSIESQIVETLTPQIPIAGEAFAEYNRLREQLPMARMSAASFFSSQEKLRDAFFAAYEQIAAAEHDQGRPLVLLFDSIEHAVAFPDPALRTLVGPTYTETNWGGVYWLIEALPQLSNTVIVLAGQAYTLTSSDVQLFEELERRIGQPPIRVQVSPIDAADYAVTARYLFQSLALPPIDDARLQVWFAISEGLPIWLGLLLTATVTGTLPDTIAASAASGTSPGAAELRHQLINSTFLGSLGQEATPLTTALRHMVWLRKGLTTELLGLIEPECDVESVFSRLRQLPIVQTHQRVRPAVDGSFTQQIMLFLHEYVYTLIDQQNVSPPHGMMRQVVDFYNEHIIAAVNKQRADVSEQIQDEGDVAIGLRLRRLRDDIGEYRLLLDLDRLYYYFQSSPEEGLQSYNLVSYNAVLQRLYGYNTIVRQEGMRNIYQLYGDSLPLDIEIESVALWMLRAAHVDTGKIDRLLGQAQTYLEREDAGLFQQAFLKLAIAQALLIDGRPDNETKASGLLEEAERLAREAGDQASARPWDNLLVAQIVHWRGVSFNRGFTYQDAANAFRRSYTLARRWKNLSRGLQAQTLTELALAYSEQGDSEDGRSFGELALREQQRLGSSYYIALAYNTLAQVEIRGGRAGKSLDYARRAEALIRDIDIREGRIDILLTLSESLRKAAEDLDYNRPRQQEYFSAALQVCDTIEQELGSLPATDRRHCYVIYQRGVIYRSRGLVRARRQPENLPDETAKHDFAEARRHLDSALRLARQLNVPHPTQIDIAEDLAAVDVHEELFGEDLERHLSQAEDIAPDEYKFEERIGLREIPHPIHIYWRELGQCQLQRAMRSFGLYEQSEGSDVRQLRAAGEHIALMIGYLLKYSTRSWMLRRAEQLVQRELHRLGQRARDEQQADTLLDTVLLAARQTTRTYAIPIEAQTRIERIITKTRRDRSFDYNL